MNIYIRHVVNGTDGLLLPKVVRNHCPCSLFWCDGITVQDIQCPLRRTDNNYITVTGLPGKLTLTFGYIYI